MDKIIEGLILTPLKIILHPEGNIYHVIRNFDPGYNGFGEVYISTIKPGSVKAWKKHLKMTCNFIVPVGEIKVVVHDKRVSSSTFGQINEFLISPENYFRLTIPPELWYGFTGKGARENIMINFTDIPHDPSEQINVAVENIDIHYKWY